MSMKNPPHPGGLIRREIIEPLGLSVSSAARDPWCFAPGYVPVAQRAHPSVVGNGFAHQESLRPEDGSFDEDATRL